MIGPSHGGSCGKIKIILFKKNKLNLQTNLSEHNPRVWCNKKDWGTTKYDKSSKNEKSA